MMYKVLNKLFGFDYIQWHNHVDDGIARIHKSKCGNVFYWRYKVIKVADIVKSPNQVLWLTCSPDKYFGDKK